MLKIIDVRSGAAHIIPGSEGRFSPRWSPDGRWIAALSIDSRSLAVFDLTAKQWRDLVHGDVGLGWPNWTRDSLHIQLQQGASIVRLHLRDGQVKRIASLEGVTQVAPPATGPWIGVAQDDAPIVLRELTAGQDIYAFHLAQP